MKARPYSDGSWCALPSGALVWFDAGVPSRVRWRAGEGRPVDDGGRVLDELGWITGQRYRLGQPVGVVLDRITPGWEAQVLP